MIYVYNYVAEYFADNNFPSDTSVAVSAVPVNNFQIANIVLCNFLLIDERFVR
jgi:hypothetical protein